LQFLGGHTIWYDIFLDLIRWFYLPYNNIKLWPPGLFRWLIHMLVRRSVVWSKNISDCKATGQFSKPNEQLRLVCLSRDEVLFPVTNVWVQVAPDYNSLWPKPHPYRKSHFYPDYDWTKLLFKHQNAHHTTSQHKKSCLDHNKFKIC